MDYADEIRIWNRSIINILDVKHGLTKYQDISFLFETSAFIFVTGSSGKISFAGKYLSFKSNILIHIAANERITLSSESDELEYYAVVYNVESAPNAGRKIVSAILKDSPFSKSYALQISSSPYLSQQFILIANEWNNGNILGRLKITQNFYAILCSLYSELTEHQNAPLVSDAFDYVYHFLQQNFTGSISINELAYNLHISRSTLHRQFKERLGLSPQQYLMQLRMEAACKMLETRIESMDEIAAACGLRDKSYFTRVFKDKYGITPGMYRNSHARVERDDFPFNHMSESRLLGESEENYLLIESMGRFHRYFEAPKRIVCLDYSAAEMCVALGVSDRITGVASADESLADCEKKYRSNIARAPFLKVQSKELNVPSFQSVLDCRPDIVIGTGFSFSKYGGVADVEEFESAGIHVYAMKATYTLDADYDSVYDDIRNLGKIFGKEEQAEQIIQDMMAEEAVLERIVGRVESPVRVFSYDTVIADKVITCGQSLENHMINSAGGINIFGDRTGLFVSASWQDVAKENPQVILVHSFHSEKDGIQKVSYLNQIPEIAETDAVRNSRIYVVGIKKVFPALDNLKTALLLADYFNEVSGL